MFNLCVVLLSPTSRASQVWLWVCDLGVDSDHRNSTSVLSTTDPESASQIRSASCGQVVVGP